MVNLYALSRKYPVAALSLAAATLLAVTLPVAAAPGRGHAEAPMAVVTEGLTVEEHLLRQAELSARLNGELPAVAGRAEIPLTPEEIDAIDRAPGNIVPLKIGVVKPVAPVVEIDGLSANVAGTRARRGTTGFAERTSDGGFVWAMVVTSPDAGAIRLHLEEMSLPESAEIYLYSRDGQAYGPYTGSGPNGTGEVWTATIFGPEAVLQVRLSGPTAEADLDAVSFRVQEAGLITRSFAEGLRPPQKNPASHGGTCGNASCVVDATCFSGIADSLKLAVAKMEWIQGAFIYTCTGGLLSDNNPTLNNFFLTANHCLSKNSTAGNVNFYWRFASSTCDGACPSNSGWPYITSGSTVSKSGRRGDFTLLRLNSNPPSGSVFLGWTSTPVANTNGTDLFRVSNPNFGPQVYSAHDVDTGAVTCSGWPRGERIYSRDTTGAIDGGSSGSPVVNSAGQVVGQLSGTCGFSPSEVCASGPGEDNATVDGAFAYYYSLVQPFLNP